MTTDKGDESMGVTKSKTMRTRKRLINQETDETKTRIKLD